MKSLLLAIILVPLLASGQYNPDAKRDYVWVFGGNYNSLFDDCVLDFNSIQLVNNFTHDIHLDNNNSSICDTSGSLLFFTNGNKVVDRNGDLMPNGDSLSFSNYYEWLEQFHMGPNIPQSVLILPHPFYPKLYYIYHLRIEFVEGIPEANYLATGLLLSIVDMNQNNGFGDVVLKNQVLINDTLQNGIVATRHGNGRDWWIIVPTYHIGSFYEVLLHPEGNTVITPPESGPFDRLHTPHTAFSPDGSKIFYNFNDPFDVRNMYLFSFNRCDGSVSELHHMILHDSDNSFGFSACFSPDSKLVYYNTELHIYQYDVSSLSNESSQTIVATYDGFVSSLNHSVFTLSCLGPDNKIYISGGNSNVFHVIENPNVRGPGCNVQQHAIITPTKLYCSIPNMPNFRLKNWVGSPCDYLTSNAEIKPESFTLHLKASPNPATTVVRFEAEAIQGKGTAVLYVYDALGRTVAEIPVSPGQSVINYDVSKLKGGMYVGILRQGESAPGMVRFVVSR
jgi:hypothetical protein